jgi:DNA-binding LytR/AlgR family response regulator
MSELSRLEFARSRDNQKPPLLSVIPDDNCGSVSVEKGSVNSGKPAAIRHNKLLRPRGQIAHLQDTVPQVRGHSSEESPRIAIRSQGRILLLDPREVVAVKAQGNYVMLHRQTNSHLLRESISVIAEKLKPYGFVRIHRSVLVNGSHVEEIRPCRTGEYRLRVRCGEEYKEYMVTRTYRSELRNLAELWIGVDVRRQNFETSLA